jgi:4-carboxymuconolactone decarboxylase
MRSAIIATAIGVVIVSISTGPNVMAQSQDRMPPIAAEKLTDAQKKAIEEFKAARSAEVSGPFVPLLRSPEVMSRARAMGDYLRFRSVLPPRLSEFVILITARQWTQNYEWNAHEALARQAGVSPDVVKAIADGRRPEHMTEDEDILYTLVGEITKTHAVSDATYARTVGRFGEQGVIDTLGITGYYTLLAMVLNTARTPLPGNAKPQLRALP